MNYVFLDLEVSGFDYMNDSILQIEMVKTDKFMNFLDKYTRDVNKSNLFECMCDIRDYVSNSYVLVFNGEFILSFLLKNMYDNLVDMKFWYLDVYNLLKFAGIYDYKKHKVHDISDIINCLNDYMNQSKLNDLDSIFGVKPKKWLVFFRGFNYPEHLGDHLLFTFYIADKSISKKASFLATLREIRGEYFSDEEMNLLVRDKDVLVLINLFNISDNTLLFSKDYYLFSYIDIKALEKEIMFIKDKDIKITLYGSIYELKDKNKKNKELLDIIISKIVREKEKWSRW